MSEALRLADEHLSDEWIAGTRQWRDEAAAELRRLHELNVDKTEIIAALGAMNQEMLDVLREIMSWEENDDMTWGPKARAAIAKALKRSV